MKLGEKYRVKSTPHTREFGIRTFGALNAVDDRAWPMEAGTVVKREWTAHDGSAMSDLVLEFERGRRTCVDSLDEFDRANLIRARDLRPAAS